MTNDKKQVLSVTSAPSQISEPCFSIDRPEQSNKQLQRRKRKIHSSHNNNYNNNNNNDCERKKK